MLMGLILTFKNCDTRVTLDGSQESCVPQTSGSYQICTAPCRLTRAAWLLCAPCRRAENSIHFSTFNINYYSVDGS